MSRTIKAKKYKGKHCGKDCDWCHSNRLHSTWVRLKLSHKQGKQNNK